MEKTAVCDAVGPRFLPCEAIIFDCDGVLVDSNASIERAWLEWAKQFDVDVEELFADLHGRRTIDTIARVLPPERVDEGVQAIMRQIGNKTQVLPAMAGVKELLASLPTDRWAVFTAGARHSARERIKAAGLPVPEVFITAESVRCGKPSPEGFELAAERLGFAPGQCVMVEDSPAGLMAATLAKPAFVLQVGHQDPREANVSARIEDFTRVRWTGSGLELGC